MIFVCVCVCVRSAVPCWFWFGWIHDLWRECARRANWIVKIELCVCCVCANYQPANTSGGAINSNWKLVVAVLVTTTLFIIFRRPQNESNDKSMKNRKRLDQKREKKVFIIETTTSDVSREEFFFFSSFCGFAVANQYYRKMKRNGSIIHQSKYFMWIVRWIFNFHLCTTFALRWCCCCLSVLGLLSSILSLLCCCLRHIISLFSRFSLLFIACVFD